MKNYSNKFTYLIATAFLALSICLKAPGIYADNANVVEKKKEKKIIIRRLRSPIEKTLEETIITDVKFEKADVRDILNYLSEETKVNIYFCEKNTEEKSNYLLTVYFEDISALGILEMLAMTNRFDYYIDKKFVWVGKRDDLIDEMKPVIRIYSPPFGNAESLKGITVPFLSEKGTLAVIKDSNILIIRDIKPVIKEIDNLFEKIH